MRQGIGFRERVRRDGIVRAATGCVGWRLQRALSPLYARWLPPSHWPFALVQERVDPMLELLKLENVLRFLKETESIPGEVAECGVYRGGTLVAMALWLRRVRSSRTIHGFDSFSGFPTGASIDFAGGKSAQAGRLGDTSEHLVREKAQRFNVADRTILHAGFFDETLPRASFSSLSFLHLDCDLYESYRTALHYLWPKLTPGGMIVFDEFADPAWPGARQAIDEFFADKIERPAGLVLGQGYVRKAPAPR